MLQPLIIASVPRPPATTSTSLGPGVTALIPAPASAAAAFSPYASSPVPPTATRSAGLAMEGKSLFTCHQCGALLKFRYNPVSIEEKIMRLRPVTFEHPEEAAAQQVESAESPRPTEEGDAGEQTDADEGEGEEAEEEEAESAPAMARSSLSQQPPQTPVIVPEIVWECQRLDSQGGTDGTALWIPSEFDPANGICAFASCNRGDMGQSLTDVVPARLLNKPHLWVTDWEVDVSLPRCDAEGWVYATSFAAFDEAQTAVQVEDVGEEAAVEAAVEEQTDETAQDRTVRRRRVIRKRRIDGSDLSWFQELLDCRYDHEERQSDQIRWLPTCHDCEVAVLYRFTQYDRHGGTLALPRFSRPDSGAVTCFNRALNELEDDHAQYEAFLTQFAEEKRAAGRGEGGDDEADEWQDDPELRALEDEERRLLAELEAIEDETAQVTAKRRELWSTGTDLEQLIHGTFAEGAFLQHLLGLSRDERQSVGVFAVHASDMLRRLQRYNVANDVFHIWHDGLFGTINGLRLGRLPSKPVEWVEINAALGQAVLLLATIADRANFEFSRNRLVPRGSFSRVVNMYGKEYSLYSDGGMFRRRGFNQAMVLFLECVEDAGRRAMKEEPSLKFPYKVERGKIGGLPISLGNDEQWTRALKYLLTHLKWLLAWISKRY
ncbi:hypothetical protein BBJ28_00003432 [Nothophytophthora sp. Chile5]|nr:hypothetical protein BBJ28_00003432 [Nothophytophthora sp. Chile5]